MVVRRKRPSSPFSSGIFRAPGLASTGTSAAAEDKRLMISGCSPSASLASMIRIGTGYAVVDARGSDAHGRRHGGTLLGKHALRGRAVCVAAHVTPRPFQNSHPHQFSARSGDR